MPGVIPYLIRAYCSWIEDSNLTPYLLVDCSVDGVFVPKGFIKKGKIVLNIGTSAASDKQITNEQITFKARFNGKSEKIIVPCHAVLSIYAQENGEGMVFANKAEDATKKPGLKILE